jgi:hypothetical protein
VHAFSAPVAYLFRPYIVYRSRDVVANQAHPTISGRGGQTGVGQDGVGSGISRRRGW